ncbi:MAG: PQQ-dependent sugar dehydrogenase [Acidobacteria bacterium]|nr:PQQ-dependent sugar dehydrogenase [Acidobacteriota bacterium]
MRRFVSRKARVCALVVVACICTSGALAAAELPRGFRLEPILTGLNQPTSLAGTPDGRILITERGGTLRAVEHGRLVAAPLCTLNVATSGDAGLLGIAVHPNFSRNGFVYLYYTTTTGTNRVSRVRLDRSSCTDDTLILGNLGSAPSAQRLGGGIAFGPDGKLYVATGDFENGSAARDNGVLAGKVLRVNDDGTVPSDNPTAGSFVFARGIRNGRGLDIGADGKIIVSDAGAASDTSHDEINRVPTNGDLGWNAATGSSGGVYDDPLVSWNPVIGAAGVAIYGANAFPDLSADGKDNDHDRYGADEYPGVRRTNDNGAGICVGSTRNGLSCTTNAECPARRDVTIGFFNEASFCELRDEPAEYCPGGVPYGDDGCGSTGARGIDEPDESYWGSIFMAAGSGNAIMRAVLDGAGAFTNAEKFLDSTALPNCPTNWTDVMAGADGFLYAVARNGGGTQGGLYRIIHDGEIGPREVSRKGTYFPLGVRKGATPNQVEVSFEDLRSDALQPRDNGTDPQPPAREYSVFMGTLGNYYSHAVVSGLNNTPGTAVNDALRSVTFDSGNGSKYFLVSARSAISRTLGSASNGTRGRATPSPTSARRSASTAHRASTCGNAARTSRCSTSTARRIRFTSSAGKSS